MKGNEKWKPKSEGQKASTNLLISKTKYWNAE